MHKGKWMVVSEHHWNDRNALWEDFIAASVPKRSLLRSESALTQIMKQPVLHLRVSEPQRTETQAEALLITSNVTAEYEANTRYHMNNQHVLSRNESTTLPKSNSYCK